MTTEDCSACDFNKPGKTCLRKMQWVWRGETYPATANEYFQLKNQLASEMVEPETVGGPRRSFDQLPREKQAELLQKRLQKYCQTVRAQRVPSSLAYSRPVYLHSE